MLKADECLQRAVEAEQWAKAEGQDELHALYLKSAQSWRALAMVAQLAEETLTTEFD